MAAVGKDGEFTEDVDEEIADNDAGTPVAAEGGPAGVPGNKNLTQFEYR